MIRSSIRALGAWAGSSSSSSSSISEMTIKVSAMLSSMGMAQLRQVGRTPPTACRRFPAGILALGLAVAPDHRLSAPTIIDMNHPVIAETDAASATTDRLLKTKEAARDVRRPSLKVIATSSPCRCPVGGWRPVPRQDWHGLASGRPGALEDFEETFRGPDEPARATIAELPTGEMRRKVAH